MKLGLIGEVIKKDEEEKYQSTFCAVLHISKAEDNYQPCFCLGHRAFHRMRRSRAGAAIRSLGQDPEGDLKCVYCDGDASTWDHLVGLVKEGEFRGHGHQIGNLVPCCGPCNSKKGAKEWVVHLKNKSADQTFEARCKAISDYSNNYAVVVDPKVIAQLYPDDWKRYREIKEQILGLMKDADEIASKLRDALVAQQKQSDIATKV